MTEQQVKKLQLNWKSTESVWDCDWFIQEAVTPVGGGAVRAVNQLSHIEFNKRQLNTLHQEPYSDTSQRDDFLFIFFGMPELSSCPAED